MYFTESCLTDGYIFPVIIVPADSVYQEVTQKDLVKV